MMRNSLSPGLSDSARSRIDETACRTSSHLQIIWYEINLFLNLKAWVAGFLQNDVAGSFQEVNGSNRSREIITFGAQLRAYIRHRRGSRDLGKTI